MADREIRVYFTSKDGDPNSLMTIPTFSDQNGSTRRFYYHPIDQTLFRRLMQEVDPVRTPVLESAPIYSQLNGQINLDPKVGEELVIEGKSPSKLVVGVIDRIVDLD